MRNRYLVLSVFLSLAGLFLIADAAHAQRGGLFGRRGGYNNGYNNGYDNGYGYQNGTYVNGVYYPNGTYPFSTPYVDSGTAMAPNYSFYPPVGSGFLPGAQPTQNSANIRVMVPDNQAKVWVDGKMTQQGGMNRLYHTPSLVPGSTYSVQVRATWMENGREVSREQTVNVSAGQTSMVDFNRTGAEGIAHPKTGK